MAMNFWGITRTVGLWVLIVCIAISISLDFIGGNSIWAWFKSVVAGTVVAYEIYYYLVRKRTISTKYKEFLIKRPMIAWASLITFALALVGLIVHLAVW